MEVKAACFVADGTNAVTETITVKGRKQAHAHMHVETPRATLSRCLRRCLLRDVFSPCGMVLLTCSTAAVAVVGIVGRCWWMDE